MARAAVRAEPPDYVSRTSNCTHTALNNGLIDKIIAIVNKHAVGSERHRKKPERFISTSVELTRQSRGCPVRLFCCHRSPRARQHRLTGDGGFQCTEMDGTVHIKRTVRYLHRPYLPTLWNLLKLN